MPRDAITLADVREPAVEIVCEPCGRRGRYNVERLIANAAARSSGDHRRLPESPLVQHLRPMQSAVCALLRALNISREPPAITCEAPARATAPGREYPRAACASCERPRMLNILNGRARSEEHGTRCRTTTWTMRATAQ
jgi:hypothetical protein